MHRSEQSVQIPSDARNIAARCSQQTSQTKYSALFVHDLLPPGLMPVIAGPCACGSNSARHIQSLYSFSSDCRALSRLRFLCAAMRCEKPRSKVEEDGLKEAEGASLAPKGWICDLCTSRVAGPSWSFMISARLLSGARTT